jgi:exodeoxyribonuclease-3
MKLYSWNVNGIRAVHRKGLFLSFLEKHQPDILCLQETKAERGQVEIDLAGYSEYWNSAVKKGLFRHGDIFEARAHCRH